MPLTIQPYTAHNLTFPWVFWDGWFSEEEINAINQYCGSLELIEGSVVNPDVDKSIDHSIRKSNVHMVQPNRDTQWMFQKISGIIDQLNADFYQFNLYGFGFFQYSEYRPPGDKYDVHMDMIMGPAAQEELGLSVPRKLSLILCLSDPSEYEGGELHILQGQKPEVVEQKKGRILIFPSWMMHAVTPVTAGVRKSIVVWCQGPKFK